jgi:hypothetical protein
MPAWWMTGPPTRGPGRHRSTPGRTSVHALARRLAWETLRNRVAYVAELERRMNAA